MAILIDLNGSSPKIGINCWLAPTATIVGDVICGNDCTFWFNTVVRGDVNSIRIGERTNIQDNAVIHCTYEKAATYIGSDVSIGHSAIVHGCTIKDFVLVGMGAIIMDHVVVNSNSIIAAGAVVLENTIIEEGSIYAGIPARKVKESSSKAKEIIGRIAKNYPKYASWYQK